MEIPSLYALFLQHRIICTDTRNIKPGCIFFALKGEQFDGNTFALEAIQQGAAYAIISDNSLKSPQLIYVEDTLSTLQSLAQYYRRQLHIPVLAITGSNGKTTTKELITAVLLNKYKVHATAGNFNNHIGVPLTLLAASADVEFIVCEMGANHPGEIASLCDIAEPTHGIITNIGQAHLEGFGSIAGVKKAKGELFDFLNVHGGVAFINVDDLNLRDLGGQLNHKITYGFDTTGNPQYHFKYVTRESESGFTLMDTNSSLNFDSAMYGQYNAINVLAAFCIGSYFKVDQTKMIRSLSEFVSKSNRSEVITYRGCTIIKDAYNANPSSMELAIKSFAANFPQGWVMLGDMKELGETSNESHLRMIELVLTFPFERIILVGNAFSEAFLSRGITDSRIETVLSIESIKVKWNWHSCMDKALLLKGSRSMHLERLLLEE